MDTDPTAPVNPLIHLNGTSARDLTAGWDRIAERLCDLCDAWGDLEFNARDYYPQGSDAWPRACTEREAMARRIREVQTYVNRVRESLYEQEAERERRAAAWHRPAPAAQQNAPE
jgi:hypothetical protein